VIVVWRRGLGGEGAHGRAHACARREVEAGGDRGVAKSGGGGGRDGVGVVFVALLFCCCFGLRGRGVGGIVADSRCC
jgi:hypothetical protein